MTGRESLVWKVEKVRKKRQGDAGGNQRPLAPEVFATGTERCVVRIYKIFKERRTKTTLVAASPFFLQTDHKKWVLGPCWYKTSAAGQNTIGNILTEARKRFGLSGKKVSKHSVQKTSTGRLLESDIPETFVAQQQGMKNTDSLKRYEAPGDKHREKISHALDRFVPPIQSPANITEPATSPAPATNSITPHSSGFHMETPMSRSFLAFYPLVRSATRLTAALHSALGRPRNKTKQQQQHQQK